VEPAPAGSRREAWLVLAVSVLLVALVVSATVFLVADTGSPAAVLTGVSVLVSLVALGVAYAGSVAARTAAVASAAEARLARLDATAAAVSLRLCGVVGTREDGGDVRFEAALEFANHATVPAVVHVGAPSLGHVRERGPLSLPPGATVPVRLTHRVPAAELDAALRTWTDHRYGWSVTVPATVENLAGTVVDDVRLTFRFLPFLRTARGAWTWTEATAEHDGGYARLHRREYRTDPVSG
jgi:hypothetical protein